MNLVIDHGNTHIKIGFFEASAIQAKYTFEKEESLWDFLTGKKFDYAIMASVVQSSDRLLRLVSTCKKVIKINAYTPLPIKVKYETINTLGADRIAIACGMANQAPHQNCLAVSMGTCITFNFVDTQATYYGGAISPGIKMRYQALSAFTSKLPLLAPKYADSLIGNSTEECIHIGVMGGLLAEIEGVIDAYTARYPGLQVVVCGGDSHWANGKLRSDVSLVPDLVLVGLNKILLHNVDL